MNKPTPVKKKKHVFKHVLLTSALALGVGGSILPIVINRDRLMSFGHNQPTRTSINSNQDRINQPTPVIEQPYIPTTPYNVVPSTTKQYGFLDFTKFNQTSTYLLARGVKRLSNADIFMQNELVSNQDDGVDSEFDTDSSALVQAHYVERGLPFGSVSKSHFSNAMVIHNPQQYKSIILNFTTIAQHEPRGESLSYGHVTTTINDLVQKSNRRVDDWLDTSVSDSNQAREDHWTLEVAWDPSAHDGGQWVYKRIENRKWTVNSLGKEFHVLWFDNNLAHSPASGVSYVNSDMNADTPYVAVSYGNQQQLGVSLKTVDWLKNQSGYTGDDYKNGTSNNSVSGQDIVLSLLPRFDNEGGSEQGVRALITDLKATMIPKDTFTHQSSPSVNVDDIFVPDGVTLTSANIASYLKTNGSPLSLSDISIESVGQQQNYIMIGVRRKNVPAGYLASTSYWNIPLHKFNLKDMLTISQKYGTEYDWSSGSPLHYSVARLPQLQLQWNAEYFKMLNAPGDVTKLLASIENIKFTQPALKQQAIDGVKSLRINGYNFDTFKNLYESSNQINIDSLQKPAWWSTYISTIATSGVNEASVAELKLQASYIYKLIGSSSLMLDVTPSLDPSHPHPVEFKDLSKPMTISIDPQWLNGHEDNLDWTFKVANLRLVQGQTIFKPTIYLPKTPTVLYADQNIKFTPSVGNSDYSWNTKIQVKPKSIDGDVTYLTLDGKIKMNSDFLITYRDGAAVNTDPKAANQSDYGFKSVKFYDPVLKELLWIELRRGVWYVLGDKWIDASGAQMTLEAVSKKINPAYVFVAPWWSDVNKDPDATKQAEKQASARAWWSTRITFMFNQGIRMTINPFKDLATDGGTLRSWTEKKRLEITNQFYASNNITVGTNFADLTSQQKDALLAHLKQHMPKPDFEIKSVKDNGRTLRDYTSLDADNIFEKMFGIDDKGLVTSEGIFTDGDHKVVIDLQGLKGINNAINFVVDTTEPETQVGDEITKDVIRVGKDANGVDQVRDYYYSSNSFDLTFTDENIREVNWLFTDSSGEWWKIPYPFKANGNSVSINVNQQGLMAFEIVDNVGNTKVVFANIKSDAAAERTIGVAEASGSNVLLPHQQNNGYQDGSVVSPVSVYLGAQGADDFFIDRDITHLDGNLFLVGEPGSLALSFADQQKNILAKLGASSPEFAKALDISKNMFSGDSTNPLDHKQLQYGDEVQPFNYLFTHSQNHLFQGAIPSAWKIEKGKLYRYSYSSALGISPTTTNVYFYVNEEGKVVEWRELLQKSSQSFASYLNQFDPSVGMMRIGAPTASAAVVDAFSKFKSAHDDQFGAYVEYLRADQHHKDLVAASVNPIQVASDNLNRLKALKDASGVLTPYGEYQRALQILSDFEYSSVVHLPFANVSSATYSTEVYEHINLTTASDILKNISEVELWKWLFASKIISIEVKKENLASFKTWLVNNKTNVPLVGIPVNHPKAFDSLEGLTDWVASHNGEYVALKNEVQLKNNLPKLEDYPNPLVARPSFNADALRLSAARLIVKEWELNGNKEISHWENELSKLHDAIALDETKLYALKTKYESLKSAYENLVVTQGDDQSLLVPVISSNSGVIDVGSSSSQGQIIPTWNIQQAQLNDFITLGYTTHHVLQSELSDFAAAEGDLVTSHYATIYDPSLIKHPVDDPSTTDVDESLESILPSLQDYKREPVRFMVVGSRLIQVDGKGVTQYVTTQHQRGDGSFDYIDANSVSGEDGKPTPHPVWVGDMKWNGYELIDVDMASQVERKIIENNPNLTPEQLLVALNEYYHQTFEGKHPDLDGGKLIQDAEKRLKPSVIQKKSETNIAPIILGSVFGFLALVGIGTTVFILRKKSRKIKS